MLLLGRENQRPCNGCTRRAFMQIGGSSVLGLSLADLLSSRARAGAATAVSARSVILLWLWGGPAQLDTWDPKPNAPLEFRGPFAPIATAVPGIRICELFPKLATVAQHFTILRSLHTQSNDHGIAGTIGLTGSIAGGVGLNGQPLPGSPRPATGAVVARVRAPTEFDARTQRAQLPPFLVVGGRLHQGKKAILGEGGGALGALYDPFRLLYDPATGTKIPALQLSNDLTPERLGDRRQLLQSMTKLQKQHDALQNSSLEQFRKQAFQMLLAPEALKVFDLNQERAQSRDRYGKTRFGQSCLLARRLVEQGVPFVQVNWSDHVEAEEDAGDGGWDHHYRNFQIMQDRHAPWLDQALTALLMDLHERRLLSSTLVIAIGEFGRSPKINDKAGREHWEHCYSALVAGGGVHVGRIVGASDARAEHPREYPITPADLTATIHHLVGITSEQAATLGIGVGGKVIQQLI